jgi:hypothetical protein
MIAIVTSRKLVPTARETRVVIVTLMHIMIIDRSRVEYGGRKFNLWYHFEAF